MTNTVDYSWVDLNVPGIRKAICMLAEKKHEDENISEEDVGNALHKTTQRSGLMRAPAMIKAIQAMAEILDENVQSFCKMIENTNKQKSSYKYDLVTDCVVINEDFCISFNNCNPTQRDFDRVKRAGEYTQYGVMDLQEATIFGAPAGC